MPVSQPKQGTRTLTVRGASNLPQTGQAPVFTIVGTVVAHAIEAEVTTIFQAQANAVKWIANPTVGSDTDICATVEGNAAAVGAHLSITGTFATAMVKSTNGAHVHQASPVVLTDGTLDFSAAASSTGQYKASILWEPLTANSRVIATPVT